MRNSKITAQEIEAHEMAADQRRQSRNHGFALMSVRDRGFTTIGDLTGNEVHLAWHTKREPEGGEALRKVPPGVFIIETRGKTLAFDAEELQKWLRWA